MRENLEIDEHSWHGGARVLARPHSGASDDDDDTWRAGKWTLQSFKQLPAHARDADAARTFIAASRALTAGSAAGVRFTVS